MRFQYEPFGAPKIFKNTLGIGHWIGGLDAPKKFRIVACEDIRVCFQCFLPFGDFESFFFCVLLFFITIICAPCFFGVFFLGGGRVWFQAKQNTVVHFFPFWMESNRVGEDFCREPSIDTFSSLGFSPNFRGVQQVFSKSTYSAFGGWLVMEKNLSLSLRLPFKAGTMRLC